MPKAFARSAHHEVVACFEQALMALGHLPEQRETRAQAIDLRLDLYYALSALGEFGPMLDALREAETLAEALGDQRRVGQVSAYLSRHFWLMGDQDRALACGQRSLATASALAPCMRGWAERKRPASSYPLPSSCTMPWT